MEYSKEFVTAVVLGKDLVPRQVAPSLHLPGLGCSATSGPHPGAPSLSLKFPPPRGTPRIPPTQVSRVRGQGRPALPGLPFLAGPCRAAGPSPTP